MTEIRIQRKRTRGWRLPPGAVVVSRPSKWGNPFVVGAGTSAAEAVVLYRVFHASDPADREEIRRELRGKDLACWCPVEDKHGKRVPCHADVLLEIANAEVPT